MRKNTKKTLALILAAIAAASTVTTASAARIEQNFASTPVIANLSNSSLPMGIDPVAGQRCYFRDCCKHESFDPTFPKVGRG